MSSDALPEDAWVNNFLTSPPRPLQTSLQKRLHASTTHLNSVAELYKQRAAIEAQYAESLSKLARNAEQGSLLPKSGIEWDRSSGEGRLWDALIGEISETSTSHSTLSALLRTDFEQPLRELPSKIVAWRRISEQDAQLERTLKDYEKTSAKLEKAASKAKASSKADGLSNELSGLTSSLASLSPMVYTSYQRLDEERLRAIKEITVRWGTTRAEMGQRDAERAERAVAMLVSWETQDEVLAVGRRLGGGAGGRASVGTAPSLSSASSTPQPIRRLSSQPEGASDFSPRPTPRQNGSTNNLNPPPTSFAGGLKSMLGRKSTIGPSRGRSGSNATSIRSGRGDREGGFAQVDEDLRAPSFTSRDAPPVDEDGFSVAPADRHRNPWDEPDESVPVEVLAPSAPISAKSGGFAPASALSPAESIGETTDSSFAPQSSQPRLNLALATAPIQESEEERIAALEKMQQKLQLQPPQQPSRRQTMARGRRDVRNTMFGGVPDSNGGLGASTPVEQLELNSNGTETRLAGLGQPQPNAPNTVSAPAALVSQNRQLSVSSVSSNNPFDSPGLNSDFASNFAPETGTGLRATMLETFNVIMREGKVTRLQINGEIHLSLRLASADRSTQGPIHIRIGEFERLEKIAPNPSYLAQVPERPGEYFLNAEVLASSSGTPKGTLLFRYQVHVPPGHELNTLPLLLDPAFRAADGETRMILNLKRNSESALSASSTVTNLSVITSFGPGPNVSNVQAKPAGGIWSPSTRQMKWNLGNVAEDNKIIAKFVSEPGAILSPSNVQASWSVDGVLSSGIGLDVVHGELETGLDFAEVKKGTISGKYVAEVASSTA